jgi:hypothetical protein
MSDIKPTKKVRAVFKNTTQELRDKFKKSQCLLLISVGQEAHEGERFAATIELINASFSGCIISLYDSLQRHTMALNSLKEPSDFHEAAVKQGDLWLERNEKYYSKLILPMSITRGNDWLHHPNYLTQQEKLRALIKQDTIYKAIFNSAIDNYLSRYVARLPSTSHFNLNRAKSICFEYILEECTILCLWFELHCQFEIYPGHHNDAMEETRRRFIRPGDSNLMWPLQLDFRNVTKMKPQYFELAD